MNKKTLILIIITAALLAVSIFGTYRLYSKDINADAKKIAKIMQYNELLYEIDLNAVTEPYVIDLYSHDGNLNQIEVMYGKIGMKYADCPDQTCVHTGYINSSSMPIICLPNHIVIVIEEVENGENDEEFFDGKAF